MNPAIGNGLSPQVSTRETWEFKTFLSGAKSSYFKRWEEEACLVFMFEKKQYESERKGYFFKALLREVERLVLFDNLNSSRE